MTAKPQIIKRLELTKTSRLYGSIVIHANQIYAAVYGGGIYRINSDGSETLVVNQNRNWYDGVSAFGKLFMITNSTSASGIYEVDPFSGTAVLRFSFNQVYAITQFIDKLYLGNAIDKIQEVNPTAWTALAVGLSSQLYGAVSPSIDGTKLLASASKLSGNFGGVIHEYNPAGWSNTVFGIRELVRYALIPTEDNILVSCGTDSTRLHAVGGIYGNYDRAIAPLSTEVNSGAISCVAFNESVLIAGWPDKVYKLTNHARRPIGSKFVPTKGAAQRNYNYGLCATPDGLFVASVFEYSTNSIVTSCDSGKTWTSRTTPNTIAPMQIITVPISGSVGYRLVCVGEGGIMSSDDKGVTWTVRSSAATFPCVYRDASDGYLYAGGYSGSWGYGATSVIYRSTDNGVTWTSNYSNASGGMIQGITYDSTNASLCAVTFYGANQVYTSVNHGTSWVANATIQKQYWRGVLFDNIRGVLVAWAASLGDGSAYVMRSSNGGLTWSYDSTNTGYNDMLLEPGGRILACRLDAIHAADNGVEFLPLPSVNAGAWAKLAYSVYYDNIVACAVTGATRFMSTVSGRRTPRRIWWSYSSAPLRALNQGLVATPSGRILATATEYSTTSVVYSDNVGLTWQNATTSNTVAPMSVISIPYTNAIGYRLVSTCETAPGANPAMYSDDDGITWTLCSLAGIRGAIHLCRDDSTGYLFTIGYAGSDTSDSATTEILKSTDNGQTWTVAYTNVGGGLGTRIAYDPIRNTICAVTRRGSAHSIVSSDGGTNWTAYSGSQPYAWRDMTWDPVRECLVKVCEVFNVTSATVLSDTYRISKMPDGKEWCLDNLMWTGSGVDYNNDPSNRTVFGRLYNFAQMKALSLGDGWRVATYSDWQGLANAVGGNALAGSRLKSTVTPTHWTSQVTAGNQYGFDVRGGGYYKSDDGTPWYQIRETGIYWLGDAVLSGDTAVKSEAYFRLDTDALAFWNVVEGTRHFSIRLVRDVAPTPSYMSRSFDGGVTWTPVPGVRPAFSVVVDRSGRIFTAGVGCGQRSDDGGSTWSNISVNENSTWRKLALLEKYDKVVGVANAGTNRFLLTGNT